MHFRHPDLIDHPRYRSDFSEGAELGLRRSHEGLAVTLFALVIGSVLALVSLAANGTSFVPLLAILAAFAVLLLLSCIRSQ
jgi:hypothetical protein